MSSLAQKSCLEAEIAIFPTSSSNLAASDLKTWEEIALRACPEENNPPPPVSSFNIMSGHMTVSFQFQTPQPYTSTSSLFETECYSSN